MDGTAIATGKEKGKGKERVDSRDVERATGQENGERQKEDSPAPTLDGRTLVHAKAQAKAQAQAQAQASANSSVRARMTKPWKSVYCERLVVERNWRKGRCKTTTLKVSLRLDDLAKLGDEGGACGSGRKPCLYMQMMIADV
jgi:hypothetical protein